MRRIQIIAENAESAERAENRLGEVRSVCEPDLHVVADDARLVFGNADRRILDEHAGGDVVLPAVPRARDDPAAEAAFGERAAAMQADVVDRVEDTADVEQ